MVGPNARQGTLSDGPMEDAFRYSVDGIVPIGVVTIGHGQRQDSPRFHYPRNLAQRPVIIGQVLEHFGHDHAIETAIGKVQVVDVAPRHYDTPARQLLPGIAQHLFLIVYTIDDDLRIEFRDDQRVETHTHAAIEDSQPGPEVEVREHVPNSPFVGHVRFIAQQPVEYLGLFGGQLSAKRHALTPLPGSLEGVHTARSTL